MTLKPIFVQLERASRNDKYFSDRSGAEIELYLGIGIPSNECDEKKTYEIVDKSETRLRYEDLVDGVYIDLPKLNEWLYEDLKYTIVITCYYDDGNEILVCYNAHSEQGLFYPIGKTSIVVAMFCSIVCSRSVNQAAGIEDQESS